MVQGTFCKAEQKVPYIYPSDHCGEDMNKEETYKEQYFSDLEEEIKKYRGEYNVLETDSFF